MAPNPNNQWRSTTPSRRPANGAQPRYPWRSDKRIFTWLPTESVSIGNAAPFTAYVLGQQGEDLVYLQDSPRAIRTAPTDDIVREICSRDWWWTESIFQVFAPSVYEECPSSRPAESQPLSGV